MQPRNALARKGGREPNRLNRPKLSVRSTLVLDLATRFALADAALMYVAHQPHPLIAISAGAAFVASYKFLDDQVELVVDLFCGGGSLLFALLLLELCQHRGLGGFVVHPCADHDARSASWIDTYGTLIASAAVLVQRSSSRYSSGGMFSVTRAGLTG